MATSNADDVAVVGIGCRFPPANTGPDEYWQFLLAAGDAVADVPPDRWRWAAFYDPDPDKPAKMPVRRMAFLAQPFEELDAAFFGIAAKEAAQLDPQQRLLLEVSWEALEDAGLDPWSLRGSATGVFVGAFTADNMLQRMDPRAIEHIGPQTALTCTQTVLASRLSYFYDFRGPSFVLDTACSSSLVAIHEGVRALTAGDCRLALAGGVNRIFRPEPNLMMAKGRFLAPDGRSKAFSVNADGYGRGEGCGLVVLKRLGDAVADGDRIYAVVHGTGVNQDGRTGGPASPSPAAQAALVQRVIHGAAVDPGQVAFVEAHGTGTSVGDLAEMQALGQVLGCAPTRQRPCLVGSVKPGLGHLEGAAGVAGFIKSALVAHHGVVPPQAWLDELNPAIDFDGLNLQVSTTVTTLPSGPSRYVAVNSFGYGGTNAHALLGSPPEPRPPQGEPGPGAFPPVCLLSGHTEAGVQAIAGQYADLLAEADDLRRHDLLRAFAQRAVHEHRRAVVGDPRSFAERLADLAAGRQHPDLLAGRVPGNRPVAPVFVFSGMGPQWWAMGRGLLEQHPGFRAHAARCDDAFRRLSGWSVVAEMLAPPEASQLTATEVAQPANVLLQTGLVEVLGELGVHPEAVLGHSVGEVAAAYAAGSLDLEAAMAVAYHRSRLQARTAGTGAMLATSLSEEAAREVAEATGSLVSVAAVNAADATTLAGDPAALQRIARELSEAGVFCRELKVEVPYHSPAMEPILAELRESLSGLGAKPAGLPLYSTVAAELDGGPCDADYWAANVREPVAFHPAVLRMAADGHLVFVELGPHPVLGLYLQQTLAGERRAAVVGTLHRDHPDDRALVHAVTRLWSCGVPVDWKVMFGAGHPVVLPPYPWQRERHWQESEAVRRSRTGALDRAEVLAGQPVADCPGASEVELSPTTIPWCRDHVVAGEAVFPATGYLEAIVGRAREQAGGQLPVVVEDLRLDRPLVLLDQQDSVLRIVEGPDGRVEVLARRRGDADGWRSHATARIARGRYTPPSRPPKAGTPGLRSVDPARLYRQLADLGIDYRGPFAALERMSASSERVVSKAGYGEDIPSGYVTYPPLLDAVMHGAFALQGDEVTHLYLASRLGQVVVHREMPNRVVAHTWVRRHDGRTTVDVSVWTTDGMCVAELRDVEVRELPPARPASEAWLDECTYELVWDPSPASRRRDAPPARWAIVNPTERLTGCFRSGDGPGAAQVDLVGDAAERDDAVLAGVDAVLVNLEPSSPEQAARDAETVLELVQRLTRLDAGDRPAELVLLTHDACAVTPDDTCRGWLACWVVGFRRAVANEVDAIRIRHVDDDGADDEGLRAAIVDSDAAEVALRHGARHEPRLERRPEVRRLGTWWATSPTRPAAQLANYRLVSTEPTLEGLCWVDDQRVTPGPGQIELRVEAVGVNYKDVAKQLGLLDGVDLGATFLGRHLGMEQSVVVERLGPDVTGYTPGQRFLGCIPDGFRRYVTVDPDGVRLVPVPPGWDAVQAGGQLVALATAHMGVVEHGRVQPGEIVLVHGAAGGVGWAALQVAVSQGARVFATAGSKERRRRVEQLGAERTFDSRSLNFVAEIMEATGGRGVDVVLNTLPGDGLRASLKVAAQHGRVVEIGRREVLERGALPLALFDRNLTFVSFDLDQLVKDRDRCDSLATTVLARVEAGAYRPVPVTTFAAAEVHRAFELLARSGHVGKVVVDLTTTEGLEAREAPGPAGPVRPDRWYLVTGGTGGVGLLAAQWLADRGARGLCLVSRRGRLDAAGDQQVAELRQRGVDVEVHALDVTSRRDVERFLAERRRPDHRLGGVIHCAGVSHDLALHTMAAADMRTVLAPKLLGAAILDEATRHDPVELFILVSSVSALTGTSGQCAYAGANSALEGLAHRRRRQRRPAVALALGPVADVGMAAADDAIERYVRLLGFQHLPSTEIAAILDRATTWNHPSLAVFDVGWFDWSRAEPRAAVSHRFERLVAEAASATQDAAGEVWRRLASRPQEERHEALADLVATALGAVLGSNGDQPDVDGSLAALGLDSLMLVELQTRLNHALGSELSLMGLLDSQTVRDVARALDRQLQG